MDDIEALRTELKMLGRQHQRWKETEPILKDRIRRAKQAGMTQAEIVKLTLYTRDNVRLMCMPDDQREELRARRRKPRIPAELADQMERTASDPSARARGRGRPKRK